MTEHTLEDYMTTDLWDNLIGLISQYDKCDFQIDFLDDESCVVNCKIDETVDFEKAQCSCYPLAMVVETMLNEYFVRGDREQWQLYAEPNYWDKDGEMCENEEDVYDGGILQYAIYLERR